MIYKHVMQNAMKKCNVKCYAKCYDKKKCIHTLQMQYNCNVNAVKSDMQNNIQMHDVGCGGDGGVMGSSGGDGNMVGEVAGVMYG